ncbi:MAG: nickel-dependent hydrogenase large subunit [Acidobacteriota bacterium]
MASITLTPQALGIDPVSRIEGHLKVDAVVDFVNGRQQVVEARLSGTLFRGFEKILENRPPLDAPDITQRICGVCPVSHGLAASMTLEKAAGLVPPPAARVMRNLVLGSNFLQSHILHFYVLSVLDFVEGPAMPPWQPSWTSDKRITGANASRLVNNYVRALDIRRKCHEMGAIFGGKLPHPPAFVPGGFTTTPRATRLKLFQQYLAEIRAFIHDVYLPDVDLVASYYPDYYQIGGGPRNLLAYGVFDLDDAGTVKLFKRGRLRSGSNTVEPVDTAAITERVTASWYAPQTDDLNPAAGETIPVYPKNGAYSWLKAPRYQQVPYEVGALARMRVSGYYQGGESVLDRHRARALEALRIADALGGWVRQLSSRQPTYIQYRTPLTGAGVGLTEAPRGALGHWLKIEGGRTAKYQVVTPTCWNASPKDAQNQRGPIEQALIGTPVREVDEPVEVARVIHSFDPCLSCAVHVMRPAENARVFVLGHVHADAEAACHVHTH